MALAHKGLDYEHRGTAFTAIQDIGKDRGGPDFRTVPIIEDNGQLVGDSNAIAEHLEAQYPDRPSLFGGEAGRGLCYFVHSWTNSVVHAGVAPLVLMDIYEHVRAEERVEAFRAALTPLRLTVRRQAFLGGETPNYADYTVFGAFQWARTISDFRILAENDPVFAWFLRVGELFDGLGRKSPGYY